MKALILLATCWAALSAADWPGFRGANGAGVQKSTGLPVEFGPTKNVAWKVALPYGSSSPVLAGDRVWLTASSGDELITLCLDRNTGTVKWERRLKKSRKEQFHALNDSASPTPVSDGTNVYIFFPELGLVSYGPDGNERWKHPLGPFDNMFGMAASPTLAGNVLVQACDQLKGSFVVALDAGTGKQLWRVARPDAGLGWALPVIYRNQVIVHGNRSVAGYSLAKGELIWKRALVADASNGAPLLSGDTLYVNAAGYDQPWMPTFASISAKVNKDSDPRITPQELKADQDLGGFFDYIDENHDGFITEVEYNKARMYGVGEYGLSALKLGGTGEIADSAVQWRLKRNLPYVPSPLLYDGVIYLAKDGGIVTSVDPKDGKILKQGRAPNAGGEYFASPVAGDGKLFLTNQQGKISVLRAGAQWEPLATNDMGEDTVATPALDEDSIYIRTRSALYRFRASK